MSNQTETINKHLLQKIKKNRNWWVVKNSLEGFNIRLGQSEERKQTQKLVV